MYILTTDVSPCMVGWNLRCLSSALFLVITKVAHVSRIVIRCAATLTAHVDRLTLLIPVLYWLYLPIRAQQHQYRTYVVFIVLFLDPGEFQWLNTIFRSREFQWANVWSTSTLVLSPLPWVPPTRINDVISKHVLHGQSITFYRIDFLGKCFQNIVIMIHVCPPINQCLLFEGLAPTIS